MGTKEKLIMRLLSHPRDFTFDESVTLLRYLGFERSDKGRTSGSRVGFISKRKGRIMMHRPHPGNVLKPYQVEHLIEVLRGKGLI